MNPLHCLFLGSFLPKDENTIPHIYSLKYFKYVLAFIIIITIIVLFVTDQPEITAHPQDNTRKEGEIVTFTCNATGNPVPTIAWTRNGSPLASTGNSRISLSLDQKQLTITNVNKTDSGEYRCLANNNLGDATSDAAALDIQCNVFRNVM